MRIIIALDIIGGKCVRLTRGDFNTKKIYNEDPLEVAKAVEDNGVAREFEDAVLLTFVNETMVYFIGNDGDAEGGDLRHPLSAEKVACRIRG